MLYLYIGAAAALLLSFIFDRKKTKKALRISLKKFVKMVPPFLLLTIAVSVVLYLVSEQTITSVLASGQLFSAVGYSAILGSIMIVPGYIVYPLCGLLREQGVPYTVLSAFTTTLMMVGILTFPVEREYMGTRFAVLRNIAGLLTAFTVAVVTGVIFGEIL